jgi:ATP-dependent DNA helicase RecQ
MYSSIGDMPLNIDIDSSLKKNFGFSGFRPGQAEAIQSLLKGEHTLVVMPTGSGKSLIYQLVALHLPGITLVISPLIALMKDQVDSLDRRGIPATFINSTLTRSEQNRRLHGLGAGSYRIIYIAPERLHNTQFLNAIKIQNISLLAVDEAHCISEWGHDFRPDYLHIDQFRATLGNPLTAALTATATPQVQDDIAKQLKLSPIQRVVTGFNRPNLALEVRYTSDPASRLKALQDPLKNQGDGAAIVYTGTRRDAEEVAEFVNSIIGIKTQHYHAGLLPEERTRIQDEFMAGDLSIVVATNAFGMGIDRPDVRQVIHYSMPGSLEAYYQEAGRAGRDELPARAVLLYSPDDRVLQEWFIENSNLTTEDLRLLYDALRPASDKREPVTIDNISTLTGMQEIKVRVGLAALERASALERQGDEGIRIWFRLLEWKNQEIWFVIERHKQHQVHRKKQLEYMVAYAESNACRRRIILEHFGDSGRAEAPICCDNCQVHQSACAPAKAVDELAQSERVALIVLDAIRRLRIDVGKKKIAQILKGSKAKDIQQFGYMKHIYYGRLAVFSQDVIKEIIDQLLDMKYIKVIGAKYPVLRLTPQGEAAIQHKAIISLKLPRQIDRQKIESKKAERQAGGTIEYTAQLLSEGLSVDQIAERRGLSPNTIYSHSAKLIMAGQVMLDAVVGNDTRQKVEDAIRQVGSVDYLYPIKILLPNEIDYNVIRCVVENWKREKQLNNNRILPSDVGTSLGNIQTLPESQTEDPVTAFLSRPHPRPLSGSWNAGWALGFHSQFTGADWKRSGAGELAYRLKYQDDLSALPMLVEQAIALIASHPELAQVDAVMPVPPSTPRLHDPVSIFAKALADRIGLSFSPVLIKSRQTSPQKELHTLAQKRMNVAGAFGLQSSIQGKRLLVVDDLFDSGATLEEISLLLRKAGAAKVCVLTMTRTIHSDT